MPLRVALLLLLVAAPPLVASCSGTDNAGPSSRDSSVADASGDDASPSPTPGPGPSPIVADASPAPGPCGAAFLGDPSQPIAIEISSMGASTTEIVLHDGDVAPMMVPGQGGRVIYVGVRATNLDPCGVMLTGALRDTQSLAVRLDGRTVNLTPRGDGWGTDGMPDGGTGLQANYANVPVCANQWSARDVFGQPYDLEVTVTDKSGKTGTAKVTVTPQCAGWDPSWQPCACICRAGYVLGQSCAGDAG